MITKETIESVKNNVSIVDIVSLYVELKKKGQSLMACCPFHNENTPSFSVSPKNNIFKCFGCGVSGDAIKFVEKIENVDFLEAVKIIAKHYNIKVEDIEVSQTEDQLKIKAAKEIIKHAKTFFCDNLSKNKKAYDYLKDRQLTDEIITKFALGYSEQQSDKWKKYSETLNLSIQLQIQLGLLSDNNGEIYDRFRKRIIFPIVDQYDDTVGFAGRVHDVDSKQAKYINSQDSFLYHKSSILYGLQFAKNTIKEKGKCYLVEGYFDVIMMHQANIYNTISSSGTSLTDGQCKILKKFTKEVVVMYDGDEPGIKSANRAIEKLLINGFKVEVVILPDNDDPDSFIKKHKDENILPILDSLETDFLTFKIKSIKNENINEAADSITELINIVSSVPDDIYKTLLLQKIKQHLGVQNENLFIKQKNKPLEQKALIKGGNFNSSEDAFEREIVRFLLLYGDHEDEGINISEYIFQETNDIEFKNKDYKQILDIYASINDKHISLNTFFNHIEEDSLKSLVIDIVSVKYEISELWGEKFLVEVSNEENNLLKTIRTTILMLKRRIIQKMIKQQQNDLKDTTDSEQINQILNKISTLKQYEIMIYKEIKG